MQIFSLLPEILPVSAEDRYPVLPLALSAVRDIMTYTSVHDLTQGIVHVRRRHCHEPIRVVHIYRRVRKCTHVCAAVCGCNRMRLCAFTDTFTETSLSAHLCCAACAYNRFLLLPPPQRMAGGERWEGTGEQLTHTGA